MNVVSSIEIDIPTEIPFVLGDGWDCTVTATGIGIEKFS